MRRPMIRKNLQAINFLKGIDSKGDKLFGSGMLPAKIRQNQ